MKSLLDIKQATGFQITETGTDGGCGNAYLKGTKGKPAFVIKN